MTNKGIIYKIAETEEDFEAVYQVRKNVLVKELGYSEKLLEVEKSNNYLHLLAIKEENPIGAITINLPDDKNTLSIDKYYDLKTYKSDNDVEFKRLAVINYRKNIIIGSTLMGLAFIYVKKKNFQNIFLTTPVTNYHIGLYQKFAAQRIAKIPYEGILNLYIMKINIVDPEQIEKYKRAHKYYYRQYDKFITK
ncbi:MAG TPA: hypothetical protein DF296_03095 [Candidatus Margulisbacteria bacterium]|nr:MAG: hypothetical protein A2X43_06940 [Candidatus Margulisbacteria bacterium GWD2_39_127]OGI02983.1 MAG: hypothetical protein A2X42_12895 [Candidatus Margulisbacteria bacterium GWF2_38_17]OGI09425.1 MAG: hypothetical protein A2X41_12355 [Candidatus Margulisbacteria bacterium GWE2_39_32]HAR63321.1 hypothetical protein [Candidatus Margulisiibacteriota bacterium]HCT84167.1 hypothetical protein [Candidatus Margulisiibacteriota bacterium]